MSVDVKRLSPEHRAFVEQELARRPDRRPGRVSAAVPDPQYDSALERDYARFLEILKRSDAEHWDRSIVIEFVYHPQKFRVGENAWYTPDFGVLLRPRVAGAWQDGEVIGTLLDTAPRWRLVEVKGSWKSKNARESRSKLEAAAMLYPWFEWEAVTKGPNWFEHEVIGERT